MIESVLNVERMSAEWLLVLVLRKHIDHSFLTFNLIRMVEEI